MIAAHFFISGLWLQDADSISSGNSRLLMIFVGMVAVALIVQAIALVVMAIGAAKARHRVLAIVEEVRAKALPAIESTQDFIANTAPKMMTLAENLVETSNVVLETSNVVRNKAAEFDATLSDVNNKARVQAARADDIVTTILTGTAEVVNSVQAGIRVPIREFNGLMNGLKAGLDVLVGRTKGFGYGRANRDYRNSTDL
jgi:uncharacterized protein YoxC